MREFRIDRRIDPTRFLSEYSYQNICSRIAASYKIGGLNETRDTGDFSALWELMANGRLPRGDAVPSPGRFEPVEQPFGILEVEFLKNVSGQIDTVDHPESLAMVAAGRVEVLVVGLQEPVIHPVG